jgi:hypothetical protein
MLKKLLSAPNWHAYLVSAKRRRRGFSGIAAPVEGLTIRQMLSAANVVVVDLHRHYFDHWLETGAAYTDFRKYIGGLQGDLMRETLEKLQTRNPDFSVAGHDVPEFGAFSEHIGFREYTRDTERTVPQAYYEYVAKLDQVYGDNFEGTAGFEITPEADSDDDAKKTGHMGVPFFDFSTPEAASALRDRAEFGFEILKEAAFRDELKILNHPVKEEAARDLRRRLKEKDAEDERRGIRKPDAPPTQPTFGQFRRLGTVLYSKHIYSQMGSVVGIEIPRPVREGSSASDEMQVKKVFRGEQLFLGLNSDGFSAGPILSSDEHLKIEGGGGQGNLKVMIDKFNPFNSGGGTTVFTKSEIGRQDDKVEDALRSRQVSIVTPTKWPSKDGASSIDLPLLRLTQVDRKAVVQFEGPSAETLQNIRLQLVIANADRLKLNSQVPWPENWGNNWDEPKQQDGAFTILTLPTTGGEIDLPENTAFAYVRAIIRRADHPIRRGDKLVTELLGMTAPISFNLNQRLGKTPSFKGQMEPLRLDGEVRLLKQDLLATGNADELDWSVVSSDPGKISVYSDDQAIYVRPLAEGNVQLNFTMSDGIDEFHATIPAMADREGLLKQYMEMLKRGDQLESAQNQVARSLKRMSSELSDLRDGLISLEKEAQKQAERAAGTSRDLTAARTALGVAEKAHRDAEERLKQASAALDNAEKTVNLHRETYVRLDNETKAAGARFRDLEARRQAAWQQFLDAPKRRKDEARARWESLRDQANAAEQEWRGLQQRRNNAETALANARSDRDSATAAVTKAQQGVDQAARTARDRRKTVDDLASKLKRQQDSITETLSSVAEREKGLKRSEESLANLTASLQELDAEISWISATATRLSKVTWIPEINVSSFLQNKLRPRVNQQKTLWDDLKVLSFDLGVEFKRVKDIRDLFG